MQLGIETWKAALATTKQQRQQQNSTYARALSPSLLLPP
jgi:hypothetical protein